MNNKEKAPKSMCRRDFLKISAGAGVAVVGGYLLSEYTPWLNYDQQVINDWRSLSTSTTESNQMRELIRYATLAPNGHNTQPWKFAIKDASIEIHPDYTRRLPVVDPNDREMWISLGCALENLLLAAAASGYATNVIYPDTTDAIIVKLSKDTPKLDSLVNAIPIRQNTRSEYDGQPVNQTDLDKLQMMPGESGVILQFLTNTKSIEIALEYVNQGNLVQYADPAFINELVDWLRFNKKEALGSLDGLYSRCSGNPEVPRWLGKSFVSSTKPQQQADLDAKKLRSSAGAVVIASESDNKTGWVQTGQVYERLALQMTTLNIKSALLNQPIEVASIRTQFQNAIGVGDGFPQLLVRYGYAEALLHSLRRPVEQVLI
jgi:hypothetical protein